ncbi:Fic family protein [Burkholderia sp. Bp9140]|uniref:Fic family protein n=1 Tax=Burkholderia sp. Bp9140 TaxID=2184572 RepID=UPI000F58BA24|nr:Fic family protein [Burkholderia sp. Bp9140]RQR49526.1 Fic family protein [Burkholderia sp. Bp9140]
MPPRPLSPNAASIAGYFLDCQYDAASTIIQVNQRRPGRASYQLEDIQQFHKDRAPSVLQGLPQRNPEQTAASQQGTRAAASHRRNNVPVVDCSVFAAPGRTAHPAGEANRTPGLFRHPDAHDFSESLRDKLDELDPTVCDKLARDTDDLHETHLSLALFFDQIYKDSFGGRFDGSSIATVPGDEVLESLFRNSLGPLRRFGEVTDMAGGTSRLNTKATMTTLFNEFEGSQCLRATKPEQRWRLIIDPLKVEMIERHGIRPHPLLAFMFDHNPGYAHQVAQGWLFTGRMIDQRAAFSPELILKMAAAGRAGPMTPERVRFGANYDADGRAAMLDTARMLRDRFHIGSTISSGASQLVMVPGNPGNTIFRCDEDSTPVPVPREQELAVLHRLVSSPSGIGELLFTRHKTELNHLQSALSAFVQHYQRNIVEARTADERILAITTLYHRCEHLHPFSDGNFRVFGKYLLNFLLASVDEGFTELRDPNSTDGRSPESNVQEVRRGQAWFVANVQR